MQRLKIAQALCIITFIGLIILAQFIKLPDILYAVISFSLLGVIILRGMINSQREKAIKDAIKREQEENNS